MASGTAIVKRIITGDTVVLVGIPRGGPPPEKTISFASISVPQVAIRSLTKDLDDEPYGWTAREFLRKLLIGKKVQFNVEYVFNNKEYGSVTLEGVSVSYELVKQGLAKVHSSRTPHCASDYDELEKLQVIAKESKLGIWSDDILAAEATIRKITWAVNDVACVRKFVEENRYKQLDAIVEYVRDAECYRLLFKDDLIYCSVLVSGIQCDGFRREVDSSGQEKFVAEGFADQAKLFVELRLLNRDVKARVEATDDYGNMYASIYHPNGNIALLLLSNGFAKVQDFSARYTESAAALRAALRSAQENRLRKWKDWKPPQTLEGKELSGKIVEVVSGDCVIVSGPNHSEKKIFLASIRSARFGLGNSKPNEPFAMEAKEYLRKTLIGKTVKVSFEYTRSLNPPSSDKDSADSIDNSKILQFASVTLNNKNVSEMLVSEGLARTIQHKSSDPRAENYDTLVDLEKEAIEKNLGIHSRDKDKKKERNAIIDLTGQENISRAKAFLMQLSRSPKLLGVVDYIFHAGRYKIRIPSEYVSIAFTLACLRCPQTNRPGINQKKEEPFAKEAYLFTRDQIMQRDVTIKIERVDNRGTFIGLLWLSKKNFGVELLSKGFATIRNLAEAQSSISELFTAAEKNAKDARLGIWQSQELSNTVQNPESESKILSGFNLITVSHINSITSFFVQDSSSSGLLELMTSLRKIDEATLNEFPLIDLPCKGDIVLALFTTDSQWYRARIESYNPTTKKYSVIYVDFGNTEVLSLKNLRRCPDDILLKSIPPQARMCRLSGLLEPPDLEDEASQYFHDLVKDKFMNCKLESIDDDQKVHAILTHEESFIQHPGASVNEMLVLQGLARLDKHSKTRIFNKLQKAEEVARKSHLNVWRYGDIGDDDNLDDFPSLSHKRPPRK